jgi:restriction system protein
MPRARKNSPRKKPKLAWDAFERHVRDVLESAKGRVKLRVHGKRTLKARDAEYEVDAYAELKVFGAATIKIIIECKRYTRPVTRDLVLALYAKTQELGAHKAMLFSTSSFQRGAVAFARAHGIALVQLKEERTGDETYCVAEPSALYVTGFALFNPLVDFILEKFNDEEIDYEPRIECVLRSSPRPSTVIGSSNPSAFHDWLLSSPPPQSGNTKSMDDHHLRKARQAPRERR